MHFTSQFINHTLSLKLFFYENYKPFVYKITFIPTVYVPTLSFIEFPYSSERIILNLEKKYNIIIPAHDKIFLQMQLEVIIHDFIMYLTETYYIKYNGL